VDEAEPEELARGLRTGVPLEPDRQVDEVEVDGQRVDGEVPGGEVEGGREVAAEEGERQRVVEGGGGADARVEDGHHAVAGARVLLADVPAERVEVRELPGEEEAGEEQASLNRGKTAGSKWALVARERRR